MVLKIFFFFKQKTAYEMRISDWSSDVCSSDLPRLHGLHDVAALLGRPGAGIDEHTGAAHRCIVALAHVRAEGADEIQMQRRSEEHTSELQSLMRISYAVFCLKNKTIANQRHEIADRPHSLIGNKE